MAAGAGVVDAVVVIAVLVVIGEEVSFVGIRGRISTLLARSGRYLDESHVGFVHLHFAV